MSNISCIFVLCLIKINNKMKNINGGVIVLLSILVILIGLGQIKIDNFYVVVSYIIISIGGFFLGVGIAKILDDV